MVFILLKLILIVFHSIFDASIDALTDRQDDRLYLAVDIKKVLNHYIKLFFLRLISLLYESCRDIESEDIAKNHTL